MLEREMEALRIEILRCTLCGLHKHRKNPVVGEGSLHPKIFFIGEAPGRSEDAAGKPFVGSAGRIFDKMLESIGVKREEVYITNVVKCRPPGNRTPTNEEINACSKYLERQISLIKPRVVATLGSVALRWAGERFGIRQKGVSHLHGKIIHLDADYGRVFLVPLYHPAVALYNPGMINVLLKDIRKILEV